MKNNANVRSMQKMECEQQTKQEKDGAHKKKYGHEET